MSLFRPKHILKMLKSKQKMTTPNSERRLYANLPVKRGDLDNFFSHENNAFPFPYWNMENCTRLRQNRILFNANVSFESSFISFIVDYFVEKYFYIVTICLVLMIFQFCDMPLSLTDTKNLIFLLRYR